MNLNCKPCRVVHCYKIENNKASILGFDGIVKLNETATVIWNMSDGKHYIKDILNEMEIKYEGISREELLGDIENIICNLIEKGLLIKDWDPLLKDNVVIKEIFE